MENENILKKIFIEPVENLEQDVKNSQAGTSLSIFGTRFLNVKNDIVKEYQLNSEIAMVDNPQYGYGNFNMIQEVCAENDFEFENGKTYYKGVPVMNCIIKIKLIRNFYNYEDKQERSCYVVDVFIDKETENREVPVEAIKRTDWLVRIPKVNIYTNEHSTKSFLLLIESLIENCNVDCEDVYIRHGWKVINGKMQYVLPSVGVVGNETLPVYLKCDYGITIKKELINTPELIRQYMNMYVIDKKVSTIILLYTLLSNLAKLYTSQGFPIKFIVAVIGERGCYKTTLCKTIVNYWDDEKRVWDCSFKSTTSAIESLADKAVDSVLLVDDYMPVDNFQTKIDLAANLEMITRMYGDHTGKKRNSDYAKPGKQVGNYMARGGCVITGEHITGVDSSIARTLICFLKPGTINPDVLEYYGNNKWIHTTFLVGFLGYVTTHMEEILDMIKENVSSERKNFRDMYSNNRYGEYRALFNSIIIILQEYLQTIIRKEQATVFCMECREIVRLLIEENSVNAKERNPAYRIMCAIAWACSSKYWVLYSTTEELFNEDGIIDYEKGALFYDGEEYLYVYTKGLNNLIKQYEDVQGIVIDIEPNKIGDILCSSGMIATNKEGTVNRNGVKRPSPKGKDQRRFYKMHYEKLKEVIAND